MTWHNKTLPELMRGTDSTTEQAVPREAAMPAERVMEFFRIIMHISAVSILFALFALPGVTLIAALVAGSRHIGAVHAGRATSPWFEFPRDVYRALAGSWPISLGAVLLSVVGYLNLAFLAEQPSLLAGAFYALNASMLLIGLLWIAASVHEIADHPGLRGWDLIARTTRRAATPSRWHLALLGGISSTVILLLTVPLAGLFLAPGLIFLASRIFDPLPSTTERQL